MNDRTYNFWLVVRPAPDLPGQWIAHCLEVDVVTQGTSLEHAFQMAAEAVCMVVVEDHEAGRDPYARRAPAEYWTELYSALHRSDAVDLRELFADQSCVEFCVAQIQLFPATKQKIAQQKTRENPGRKPLDMPFPAVWAPRHLHADPCAV